MSAAAAVLARRRAVSTPAYYRLSLLLPVVLPILASPLLMTGEKGLGSVAIWLIMGSVIGAVAYIPTAVFLVVWMRGKTEREQRRALWCAPLLMAPLMCICYLLYALGSAGPRGSVDADWGEMAFYGGFVILFGYGYVALAFGLLRLLRRSGWVAPAGTEERR
jgi:hypothetical protein